MGRWHRYKQSEIRTGKDDALCSTREFLKVDGDKEVKLSA